MNETAQPEPAVWSDITTAENVLRDLVEETLERELGHDWLEKSGLTEERIEKLRDAQADEQRRRAGGEVNPRLIYYSNITDLKNIFEKHWTHFADCLGDLKTMRVYFDRLTSFRNPEMHGRDLLPFEEHLVLGITGEIRNKVTIYRSRRGGEREHFPRIEHAADSFGSVATRSSARESLRASTGLTLHPGDTVTFDLRAWDPEGVPWKWSVLGLSDLKVEIAGDRISWYVNNDAISDPCEVTICLRGGRNYHRIGGPDGFDDIASFVYRVLPR